MLNKWKLLSVRRKALESWDPPLPYLKVEFLSAHMKATCSVTGPDSHVKATCFYYWGPAASFFQPPEGTKNLEQHWAAVCVSGWNRAAHAGRCTMVPRPGDSRATPEQAVPEPGLAGSSRTPKTLAGNTF